MIKPGFTISDNIRQSGQFISKEKWVSFARDAIIQIKWIYFNFYLENFSQLRTFLVKTNEYNQ